MKKSALVISMTILAITACGGGGGGGGASSTPTTTTATPSVAAGTLQLVAGGSTGYGDGTGAAAKFSLLTLGVTSDAAGNLYVADTDNHVIRKVTTAGVVTTLAGSVSVIGAADGSGAAASFSYPQDIASDAAGNLYVTDQNNTIRKITPAGAVSTLAGTANVFGHADGTGAAASFGPASAITSDAAGNLYVGDGTTVRKITPTGVVSTFAGSQSSGYVNGSGAEVRLGIRGGITSDAAGNLYFIDTHTVRKITPSGVVSTLAGSVGMTGNVDGTGTNARFTTPNGITSDTTGNLYVADSNNHKIRKITPAGVVSTVVTSGIQLGSFPSNSDPLGATFMAPNTLVVTSLDRILKMTLP